MTKPEDFNGLQTLVTTAVLDVERKSKQLPGTEKADMAKEQVIKLLQKLVGYLIAEYLIPLIPQLVDETVKFFNHLGVFTKSGKDG